ncbi:MAG TPA: hypothetical protein VKT77_01925 [Chthonomonadaceae bacterium]|nr:hypothetical protein [Chthonomonadaceae bacterium]
MTEPESERSASRLLAEIRARYPDAPFLALGQTVFWDEPVKAVLRRLLDQHELGGRMLVGVHDTDYFAKARVRRPGGTGSRFALMPHNDGTTKDLWSAAGEISTLFGSETFPSRHALIQFGVPFERLAKSCEQGRQAFLDEVTEAWGWRGLVYTGSRDRIVNTIPLREVGPAILEMLAWGFDNGVSQVLPFCCQQEARRVSDTILGWCRRYLDEYPDGYLTDLFQYCLPRLYELLMLRQPEGIEVTSTTALLRLAPDTAHLPRFKFVHLFLDPATRQAARAAYDSAVSGSEIYTLDKFGAGALPFDVILPDRGRGTLRVIDRVVFVETRQPVAIGLKRPVTSIAELADVLSSRLGGDITLVGKAVTLVSMLAQEFIFVFNEEGSLYVRRTRKMNDLLQQSGIALDMRPILRIRNQTWSALSAGQCTLALPEHLASAFGRATITAPEFASEWEQVVAEQRALCETLAGIRKPAALIDFLSRREPGANWDERREVYAAAKRDLLALRAETAELRRHIAEAYEQIRALGREAQQLQRERGAHFRGVASWTAAELARREGFQRDLDAIAAKRRALCSRIVAWKSERKRIERGDPTSDARATLVRIENEAEMARLKIVRHALLTADSLAHTNHRPSAWWIPVLDRSGAVFRELTATTALYTEPLVSQ